MKKFIAILCLLILPYFIIGQQAGSTYVDVAKKDTVTLNIVAENKKQSANNDNLQLQLAKVIENQSVISQSVANVIQTFSETISAFTKEIEERNKNDGKLITDNFNYAPERIKKVIKIERWLNFSSLFLAFSYLLWATGSGSIFQRYTAQALVAKLLFNITFASVFYFVILKLLTFIFNGNYYVIKELMNLYT